MQTPCELKGPYGLEVDYSKYEAVLFIGGGIGITPLHSSFRGLLKMRKASTATTGPLPSGKSCSYVHLLWSARKPPLFEMFQDTWHECLELKGSSRIDAYRQQAGRGGRSGGGVEDPSNELSGFSFSFYADEAQPDEVCLFPFTHGRPDFKHEIALFAAQFGNRGLVFVCHVPPVMAVVAKLTQEYGVNLHAETFEL
jgi:hypothetical protein